MSDALRGPHVANMTGLPIFLAAAIEDALAEGRTSGKAQALKQAVSGLVDQVRSQDHTRSGDQAVIDAVVDVMGSAWRPSAYWRERLREKGYHGLASW